VFNILALGTYPEVRNEVLVAFTIGFIAARLMFWAGYVISTYANLPVRSPGFVLTSGINGVLGILNLFGFFGKTIA
jgi:hypothetical protein